MKHLIELVYKLQTLQTGTVADGVEQEVAALRTQIPAPILGHYDRLTARGKQGVAIVRNSVCASCHMKVPIGSISTLISGDDIQLCGTCGRYLYLPEEEKTKFVQAPAAPKPAGRKGKPRKAE
jgi:predicted  nucleic acid-binding Zn-ribbon protein